MNDGHDDGFEHFGFGSAGSQRSRIDELGRFRWLMLKAERDALTLAGGKRYDMGIFRANLSCTIKP
jgi:hypothetical protein